MIGKPDQDQKLRAVLAAFPGQGFAVVDGARFEDFPALCKAHRLFARSLFLDHADIEVEKAGPWLIGLAQAPDATERLLGLVGKEPAAVYWCCDAGEAILYRHLRTLNMARVPSWSADGEAGPPDPSAATTYQTVMFRHYDPRVLGSIMPVLDATQFTRVLGPASEVALMAEDLGGVRRLVADESWPPATAGLLTVRSEQMEEFIRRRALLQRERIVNYLRRVAPIETESMTEAVLHDLVLESEHTGAQLGLRSEQAHGRWAYVMVRTGGRALEQPGLRQYITDGRVSPDDKMIWLLETLAVTEARMGDAS